VARSFPPAADIRLKHLIVDPRAGLCNRLRAIASAKRLSALTGARCTIAWDWGDYRALFDDETEWMPNCSLSHAEGDVRIPGYRHLHHLQNSEGGSIRNRRVPVTAQPRIVVRSAYNFFAAEERVPLRYLKGYEAILPWFPQPHSSIMDRVRAMRHDMPPRTVGVHLRRTDNQRAISRSKDEAYFREADRLVEDGYTIFLATDNLASLQTMQQRYGDRLVHYPKASEMEERWPRAVSRSADVADDIIDLWLLAACDFVIGSSLSSYSRLAIVLNGSDSCKALDRPLATLRDPVSRLWREYVARPARSVNPPGTTY
jgi:hypothetical protein